MGDVSFNSLGFNKTLLNIFFRVFCIIGSGILVVVVPIAVVIFIVILIVLIVVYLVVIARFEWQDRSEAGDIVWTGSFSLDLGDPLQAQV